MDRPRGTASAATREGWFIDPVGRHAQRWFSGGTPTSLVRDGTVEGHDALDTADLERAASVDAIPAPTGDHSAGAVNADSSDGRSGRTPFTDGNANWVDALTLMAAPPFDPSRFSSPRYWRRFIITVILVVAAEAVVLIRFGFLWLALGALMIAAVAFIELRWGRTPFLTLWAIVALVTAFVIPQGNTNAGADVARHVSPTCGLLSTHDLVGLLDRPTVTRGQSATAPRCAWSSATGAPSGPRPSAGQTVTLTVTTPLAVPMPPAGAPNVAHIGLRAWTMTGCLATVCRQELSVVLTATFLTLTDTTNDANQTAWEDGGSVRLTELTRVATTVEERIDSGQCAYPGEDDCPVP